jgi:hypothetical protein
MKLYKDHTNFNSFLAKELAKTEIIKPWNMGIIKFVQMPDVEM